MISSATAIVCVFSVLLMGCAHHRQTAAVVLKDSLQRSVGQSVTLVGIAEPRKFGAALRGDDFYVWIDGLHDWPDGFVDHRVEVIGVLEERHDLPVFIQKPDEPPAGGIPVPEGTDLHEASRRYVVRDAKWNIVR